jgi:MFS transporter, DHA1 family, multidrug resistance protein
VGGSAAVGPLTPDPAPAPAGGAASRDRPAPPPGGHTAGHPGGRPAGRPRAWLVANLLAQFAFGLLAMTICLPSMQEWGALFGASQASVQLTFSGFVVAFGLLQLVWGPLSDRVGRRPVLLAGLAIGGLGSWLAALAPDLGWLIAARVVQGAGCAAGMVAGRALVQDLFDGPERTRMMAWVGMTLGLCPPLGSIVGGQLHVRLGWQANFVLIGALAVVLLLAAWRGLPAARPARTASAAEAHWLGAMLASYARLAREPAFVLYVAILALTTATFYSFLGGAPVVLRSYGVGPEGIGFYIMCIPLAYIGGNYLAARLVRAQGERRIMGWGQAGSLAGLALMLALGLAGVHHPLAFALPLTLLGVGHGLLMPATLAGTVGVLPALAGAAAAVAGLMQQMLGALGGWAVGLVEHEGAVNLGWMMLGFTAVAVLAQAALFRHAGRAARADRVPGAPR